jgi:hypothetical protein
MRGGGHLAARHQGPLPRTQRHTTSIAAGPSSSPSRHVGLDVFSAFLQQFAERCLGKPSGEAGAWAALWRSFASNYQVRLEAACPSVLGVVFS